VKGIKNRKTVRVYAFAFALISIVLLSSMIGTIAAKKPTNPGQPDNKGPKPPPPPPLYEFYISIGQTGDDLVLVDGPLIVQSRVDTCGWNWPPEKGTKYGGWSADTSSPWNPIPDCLFNVNIDAEPYLPVPGVNSDIFSISHYWSYRRVIEFDNQPIDFWELMLSWGFEDSNSARTLRILTDWELNMEGEYTLNDEGEVIMWTVHFNGANWELYAYNEEYYGYLLTEGTIENGFDVEIIKGDLVP